jgi:Tfp pilus assembly protein PilF
LPKWAPGLRHAHWHSAPERPGREDNETHAPALERCLALEAEDVDALVARAYVLQELGRDEEAEARFEAVLAMAEKGLAEDPNNAFASGQGTRRSTARTSRSAARRRPCPSASGCASARWFVNAVVVLCTRGQECRLCARTNERRL